MSEVRVRFAPSPTGFFHIGSARTALFNWLYARHTGGKFILRIEDTDKERNTPEALQGLLDGMRWLGMDWDEGPEVGGEYGPYFQSERDEIYQKYLQKLRDSGHAYDHEGAVFFKVSGEPQVIDDQIRGRVERLEEKDFVIFRSNGSPVFHFVNVVDDILMDITHVIRGEDHLSNTSKHVELYKAFGAPVPKFAHIPLILKQNGPGKMSKRDEGALIEHYQDNLFLMEAVRNYLCLLGWNPKTEQEVMTIQEIIEKFDFPGINKDNARFDEKKMSFINTEYVHKLSPDALQEMVLPIMKKEGVITDSTDTDYISAVLQLCQEKLRSLPTIGEFTRYFFTEEFEMDAGTEQKLFKKGDPVAIVSQLHKLFSGLDDFSEAGIENALNQLAEQEGQKPSAYFLPMRFSTTGTGGGPSIFGLISVLGKERTMSRMEKFISKHS
jgi:glutamyl-tRNA synthetase